MTTSTQAGLQALTNLSICTGCRLTVTNGRISIVHTYLPDCARHTS